MPKYLLVHHKNIFFTHSDFIQTVCNSSLQLLILSKTFPEWKHMNKRHYTRFNLPE